MAKIKYNVVTCRECDIEFLVRPAGTGRYFCPTCGEGWTDVQRSITLDRPAIHKCRWTVEEDADLIAAVNARYSDQEIKESLPGRTLISVKRRIAHLRKQGVNMPYRRLRTDD